MQVNGLVVDKAQYSASRFIIVIVTRKFIFYSTLILLKNAFKLFLSISPINRFFEMK